MKKFPQVVDDSFYVILLLEKIVYISLSFPITNDFCAECAQLYDFMNSSSHSLSWHAERVLPFSPLSITTLLLCAAENKLIAQFAENLDNS